MYTGEDIKKQRRKIQANVLKSFGEVDLFEGKGTSNNLMSSMNKAEETDLEKAHNQGDVHPNGKWYWETSAAGGKGDWLVIGGKRHKQSTSSAPKKSKPGELIGLPIYIMVNDEAVARYATSEERMEILSKQ